MDMIMSIFNEIFSLHFIEYKIVALVIGSMYLFLKYGENKYVSWIAYPIAVIYLFGEWIFGYIKHFQVEFIRNRAIDGTRYEVLVMFLVIGGIGLVCSVLAKVFGVLATTVPLPFLLFSMLAGLLSKYFNFLLLPEVMQHGNDKLTSFKLYNFCYKHIMRMWEAVKKTEAYARIMKLKERVKKAAAAFKVQFKDFMDNSPMMQNAFEKGKQGKGALQRLIAAVKIHLAEWRNERRNRKSQK